MRRRPASSSRRASGTRHASSSTGPSVEHWLNGQKVVTYELWSPDWKAKVAASKFARYPNYGLAKKGLIGIQGDHAGNLTLRRMRIRELALISAAVPAFTRSRYLSRNSVWRDRIVTGLPAIQTCSANVVTSSGSPLQSTRSATLPFSIRPWSVADAEDVGRIGRECRKSRFPGQSVRHGIAGELAILAHVVAVVPGERDAHAGLVQEFRVVEAGTEPVEIVRQIVERIEDHRHVGRGELLRDDPGLVAACDHGLHAARLWRSG